MSTTTLLRLLSMCALAGLTACGGTAETSLKPTLAANVAHMPVADCEPQACQGLRIVDSNAETFRADSARRDALAASVAKLEAP